MRAIISSRSYSPAKMIQRFAIADGLPCRAAQACARPLESAARTSSTRPASIIAFHADFDPCVQLLALAPQHKHAALFGRPAFFELQLLMADRLARCPIHFERRISRRVSCGWMFDAATGSTCASRSCSACWPTCCNSSFDLLSQLPIGRRAVEQAAEQALEIQRRAADKQRFPAARRIRRPLARPLRHTARR